MNKNNVHLLGESQYPVSNRLELARGRLEERFLEGGSVLEATLQSVGEMIESLSQVMASLDEDTVDGTINELGEAGEQLLRLPLLHEARQEKMHSLSALKDSLQGHVENMQETLRYLRTFAFSVKITGAGASEFNGFADEMLEKIRTGHEQVDGFASWLGQLAGQVKTASTFSEKLARQYDDVVPGVARVLSQDASRMGDYSREIRSVAATLTELVGKIQAKVARVLSALQIGDITRQRVEHVQAGLALVREFSDAGEGPTPSTSDKDRLALLRVLAAQMEDLLEEFDTGCQTITSTLADLADDARKLLALGTQARGGGSNADQGFLSALKESVTTARALIGQVEAAGTKAVEVGQSAAATAGKLADGVDSIRSIKTEIEHMAINTSLRCSRMGDAGKPMNVIASELGVFADHMGTVSTAILTELDQLNEVARGLGDAGSDEDPALGRNLENALAQIGQADMQTRQKLQQLAAKGDDIARHLSDSVSRLDFTRELGEILQECTCSLETVAVPSSLSASDFEVGAPDDPAIAERLFSTYTMARERQVHRRYFPEQAEPETLETVCEDDLDSVLF